MIEDDEYVLQINTELLGPLDVQIGHLCQILGETHVTSSLKVIVQARIARDVHGLDLVLFHQAIKAQRTFLKNIM